jgi:hypothetical protein
VNVVALQAAREGNNNKQAGVMSTRQQHQFDREHSVSKAEEAEHYGTSGCSDKRAPRGTES